MKRRIGLVLGLWVVLAGLGLVAMRTRWSATAAHASASEAPSPMSTVRVPTLARRSPVSATGPTPAGAYPSAPKPDGGAVVATGPHPSGLPLSYKDVPLTPELEQGLRELTKAYGPMGPSVLDSELLRRAELAMCNIQETGLIMVAVQYAAEPGDTTATAYDVEIRRASKFLLGPHGDEIRACLRDKLIGQVVPLERRMGGKALLPLPFEFIDTISFPIPEGEIYDFLHNGNMDSFYSMATRKKFSD